jgi:hypothetical protein
VALFTRYIINQRSRGKEAQNTTTNRHFLLIFFLIVISIDLIIISIVIIIVILIIVIIIVVWATVVSPARQRAADSVSRRPRWCLLPRAQYHHRQKYDFFHFFIPFPFHHFIIHHSIPSFHHSIISSFHPFHFEASIFIMKRISDTSLMIVVSDFYHVIHVFCFSVSLAGWYATNQDQSFKYEFPQHITLQSGGTNFIL